jgi:hypothetical protein
MGPLLDLLAAADGAADQDGVHTDGAERHPDAALLNDRTVTASTQRGCHLKYNPKTSRVAGQNSPGLQRVRHDRGGDGTKQMATYGRMSGS